VENNKVLILFLVFVISISSLTGLDQIANAENSANIDQCANGPLDDPQKQNFCNISDSWVNGNVNQNIAHWTEGDSNVYRLHLTNLENNNLELPGFHNVVIGYDITHSDKHAIDYLTSFNRTENLADPCIAKQQGKEVNICDTNYSDHFQIPHPVTNTQDYDNDGDLDGVLQPLTSFSNLLVTEGKESVFLWAFVPTGESIEILDVSYTEPLGDFSDSNSAQAVSIEFTTQSESAVFAWGGHIASRADWGFEISSSEFEANSAADINGSPYHMRLLELDGFGGNQDLPLDALAVLPPFNTPPLLTILNPANGDSFSSGESILFTGEAFDLEDGNISGNIVWTSNLVIGDIGTGATFITTLTDGIHTITATVTDSGGLKGGKTAKASRGRS